MKNLVFIIFAILFLASCGGNSNPNDLAAKRTLLEKKKTELKNISQEIETLREEILKLDPPKEKPPVLVSLETLEPETIKRYTEIQASLMSEDFISASSELGGRLITMTAKEGQHVRKGQLLATIDLQTLKDQKAELETGMSLAKDIYDRQKRLWDQKIGTEIQYLQAKNTYERSQKSLDLLNTQLKKAYVYAPISGVVENVIIQSGEMSSPGMPIVQIFNPNKLKIVADVPESFLGKINRGDEVKIEFPALGIETTKHVSLVGRTIDPSNRTFKIEVNTNSMGNTLKPNLLAKIAFNDFTQKDAISVPLTLVQEEISGKKYVYTAKDENGKLLAEKSYVEIGESSEDKIIITSGLQTGDRIITEGARSVSQGATIQEINK